MTYNWQQPGWPNVFCDKASLKGELAAFARAYAEAKKTLKHPQDPLAMAEMMTSEALESTT